MSIITLTTDFGSRDEYVGVMKGVILSRAPDANIIDLTHSIAPFDKQAVNYLITSAYAFFPPGTIHLIVVDPGVGSSRDIIVLQAAGQLFLAPDNGVLTMLIGIHPSTLAFKITNQNIFLHPVSTTFHGRDIFAPSAAHLANGSPPETLGPQIPLETVCTIPLPQVHFDKTNLLIEGRTVYIDRFGNLMTNIHKSDFQQLQVGKAVQSDYYLTIQGKNIGPICKSYQDVAPGAPLLIFNSRNYLEIATNSGNAARQFNFTRGQKVVLTI